MIYATIPDIDPPLPEEEWFLACQAMKFASGTRGDDTLMASMVCYDPDGGIEVYSFLDFNEEVKQTAIKLVKVKLKYFYTCVVFVTEAWVARSLSQDGKYVGPRPSEHPDRTEALICILYSEKYHVMWQLPIVKNVVGDLWEMVGDERSGWTMQGKLSAHERKEPGWRYRRES